MSAARVGLTIAQQRIYDTVVCEAAMGDRSIRDIIRSLQGVESSGDLPAVSAALLTDARRMQAGSGLP